MKFKLIAALLLGLTLQAGRAFAIEPGKSLPALGLAEVQSAPGQFVYIDYWASWCGPCQMFAPTFKASAARHANRVLHVKINTEDNQMLSQRLNIRSIPTLAAYVGGKEVNRVSGALPAASLEQFVQRALAA